MPRSSRGVAAFLACAAGFAFAAEPGRAAGPDIETYMQIGLAVQPATSADGRVVLFTTGMSGVNQLYRLTEQGWPYQLTVFPDGIDWYELSPDGRGAVVGSARGGDEQTQLYLVDAATGALTALTASPEVQYGSPAWSPDGKRLYFRSNEVNGRDFHLYVRDLASGAVNEIYRAEGQNVIEDVSPDGKRLAVVRYTSNTNSDLYVLELAGGRAIHLTPHEGDFLYTAPRFSADGRTLYLATNQNDKGALRVASLDWTRGGSDAAAPLPFLFLEGVDRWEVEDVAISSNRRYLAWSENVDGYSELRLRDLEKGKNLPAPPPSGVLGSLSVADDGTFLLAFSSPTRTSDVYRWDPRDRKLRQLTFSTYAGVDPMVFEDPKLIRYPSRDGLEIPAFLYLPPGYRGGRIPFVIHVHGGPESQFRPDFARHFQYLMQNGYGILAPNVRGSSGYGREWLAMDNYKKRMDSVQDLGAGARWLVEQGYSDAGLLAVKGASYGGYMTLAALVEFPELFAAGIDEVGIANFVTFLENTKSYRQSLREAEYGPLSDTEFLTSISPLTRVDRIRAPLLVIHGENDPRVPVGEARQIVEAIQARGGVAESLIFPDEGHGVAKLPNRLKSYRTMVDFLDRHLKNKRG